MSNTFDDIATSIAKQSDTVIKQGDSASRPKNVFTVAGIPPSKKIYIDEARQFEIDVAVDDLTLRAFEKEPLKNSFDYYLRQSAQKPHKDDPSQTVLEVVTRTFGIAPPDIFAKKLPSDPTKRHITILHYLNSGHTTDELLKVRKTVDDPDNPINKISDAEFNLITGPDSEVFFSLRMGDNLSDNLTKILKYHGYNSPGKFYLKHQKDINEAFPRIADHFQALSSPKIQEATENVVNGVVYGDTLVVKAADTGKKRKVSFGNEYVREFEKGAAYDVSDMKAILTVSDQKPILKQTTQLARTERFTRNQKILIISAAILFSAGSLGGSAALGAVFSENFVAFPRYELFTSAKNEIEVEIATNEQIQERFQVIREMMRSGELTPLEIQEMLQLLKEGATKFGIELTSDFLAKIDTMNREIANELEKDTNDQKKSGVPIHWIILIAVIIIALLLFFFIQYQK